MKASSVAQASRDACRIPVSTATIASAKNTREPAPERRGETSLRRVVMRDFFSGNEGSVFVKLNWFAIGSTSTAPGAIGPPTWIAKTPVALPGGNMRVRFTPVAIILSTVFATGQVLADTAAPLRASPDW